MQHSAKSNLINKYFHEYKFIFKTALAHESGDPGVLFAERNRGSKILWDCPFNALYEGGKRTLSTSKGVYLATQHFKHYIKKHAKLGLIQ
jgi:hypothetical protein